MSPASRCCSAGNGEAMNRLGCAGAGTSFEAYQEDALSEVESLTASDGQRGGLFAELEPELILDYSGQPPCASAFRTAGGNMS